MDHEQLAQNETEDSATGCSWAHRSMIRISPRHDGSKFHAGICFIDQF